MAIEILIVDITLENIRIKELFKAFQPNKEVASYIKYIRNMSYCIENNLKMVTQQVLVYLKALWILKRKFA